MKLSCYVGIDLGSTTTKAVNLDQNGHILGKGITNSRSNYDVACQVAQEEAEINSRFGILQRQIRSDENLGKMTEELLSWLTAKYKLANYLKQLQALKEECFKIAHNWPIKTEANENETLLKTIFKTMEQESTQVFQPNVASRSDFFRDIAGSGYLSCAETLANEKPALFDRLIGLFDKAILLVEGRSFANAFSEYIHFAGDEVVNFPKFKNLKSPIQKAIDYADAIQFDHVKTIGTGYGRSRLPFPKDQIRSEILCHGLGAHYMFPKTRTVLDIGGQDTKAIQIDENGIVVNFQMNDRCAAGCGRYLGYIADEMSMGVHELGPIALKSTKHIKINSTCTVFAGTELRERLSMGEKREDILAGLHRSMILRAMSLLARSGGVDNEFTFTGGVAKNLAATQALKTLIFENYGAMTVNISADSIFTGALGAALFANRSELDKIATELNMNKLTKKMPQMTDAGN